VTAGRRAIERSRGRLRATFQRIDAIEEDQLEARADFARYLCVLLSGFLEKAIAELLLEHARQRSSDNVQRYVGVSLQRFQNPSVGNIVSLFERFNEDWKDDLKDFLVDERAAAIGSVVKERHRIAHGESSDISYVRIDRYREQVDLVIDHIADLVDPVP
jgi:hypothetical protein